MAIHFTCREPQHLVAITDCEIIETIVSALGVKHIQVLGVEVPSEGLRQWFEVQTWINILRTDDGGIPA